MLINITFFILQSLCQSSIFAYPEVLTDWKTEQKQINWNKAPEAYTVNKI